MSGLCGLEKYFAVKTSRPHLKNVYLNFPQLHKPHTQVPLKTPLSGRCRRPFPGGNNLPPKKVPALTCFSLCKIFFFSAQQNYIPRDHRQPDGVALRLPTKQFFCRYLSCLFILAQLFLVAESSAERTNANLSGNTLAKGRVWPDFGEVDYASETGQLTLQDC